MKPKRMGRHPLKPEDRCIDTHMRLRPDTLRVIDEMAEAEGVNRTEMVEMCVWERRAALAKAGL